ncbi:MAG: PH domain-containing protein [Ancrocorticia sp.]|uniref:PH domain-containing protein n=1 Tax=Ancrocorticia sp. TaxID=2593684 RepID=UPI003F8F03BC
MSSFINDDDESSPTPPLTPAPQIEDESLQWHRFAKATMLGAALRLWAFVAVIVFAFGQQSLTDRDADDVWDFLANLGIIWLWRVLGILAGLGILATIGAAISWHFKRFAITQEGIQFKSGVFIKKHLHLRWDRIQSVDVTQQFLARLLKMGTVKVESAGGGDGLELGLLSRDQCEGLRQAILVAENQARLGETVRIGDWSGGGLSAAAREDSVYHLSPKRLLLSMVVSPSLLIGILSLAGTIALVVLESGTAALPLILVMAGALWNIVKAFSKKWDTSVFLAANGVRARAGLFSTTATTTPPGRVHAVEIYQPMWWRRFDWWILQVTVASSVLETEDDESAVILPVATREEALRMLWVLAPDLGVDEPDAFLRETLDGAGPSQLFVAAPRQSRFLDPFGWKRNAMTITRTAAVMRWGGLWRRSMKMVLHDHYQSLGLSAGPWEKRLGLANVKMRMVATTVGTEQTHLRLEDAQALLWEESRVGAQRRQVAEKESIEAWRARVGA